MEGTKGTKRRKKKRKKDAQDPIRMDARLGQIGPHACKQGVRLGLGPAAHVAQDADAKGLEALERLEQVEVADALEGLAAAPGADGDLVAAVGDINKTGVGEPVGHGADGEGVLAHLGRARRDLGGKGVEGGAGLVVRAGGREGAVVAAVDVVGVAKLDPAAGGEGTN